MHETLASAKNPLLKEVRRAVTHGSLTRSGFAVAEGLHLLEEALRSRCEIATVIAATAMKADLVAQLPKRTRLVGVSEQVLRHLDASRERPAGERLEDARPSEADERPRFGNVQVTEHSKTRGHTARGRTR